MLCTLFPAEKQDKLHEAATSTQAAAPKKAIQYNTIFIFATYTTFAAQDGKKKHELEGVHVVSATIRKSYCLCSSDPEKSHCKNMKRNLFRDQ